MRKEHIKISGKRVLIKKINLSDIKQSFVNRLNDKNLMIFSRHKNSIHTLATCKNYFLSFQKTENLYLSILDKNTKKLIGTMTVYFKKKYLEANIGILISSKKHLKKGYGQEAWTCLLDYLKEEIKVRNIIGGCLKKNLKMINIFKKSDMKYYSTNSKKEIFYIKKN